ncbi:hypothetical protein D7X30_05380 [Corallococcus sp. AB011P]|uniref:hypothetical protein n=1 Tax=Corallococcus sp. AB011P TaxID=2316735 RepID=UPI000EA1A38A|nr:hypothetical protein [Corallococcus sp. AB011P]RKG60382.1 hypothetical protein D7X30_05380 [Corallococcus sp. AB011P]
MTVPPKYKVLIALAAGIALGRFLLPILEGRVYYGIQVRQDKSRGCALFVSDNKEILGRHVQQGEGADFVDCGKAKEVAPGAWIVCDCSAFPVN